MSNSFLVDPTVSAPNEITVAVARTLSASGGNGLFGSGDGLIGNTQVQFGSGIGLSFFYSAQLVPEPATYVISVLGLVLLSVMRLKRQ